MARPLRVEFENASYHVVNRGNQRQRIFRRRGDYELFLDRLERCVEEHGAEVRAYCLMPNHFHLYLCTPQANLSQLMQRFSTAYTVAHHRAHGSSGHLFQGRYKAQLVEDEAYRSILSRYIHLNPIRVKRLREATAEELQGELESFRWSSYSAYVGRTASPPWLQLDAVLETFGGCSSKGMANYRAYVNEALCKGLDDEYERIRTMGILGREEFVDRIRRRYLLSRRDKQVPALRLEQGALSMPSVVSAVASVFELDESDLLKRRSPHRTARRMLVYCLCRFCSSRRTLREIGAELGIGVSAISHHRRSVAAEIDTTLGSAYVKIVAELESQSA